MPIASCTNEREHFIDTNGGSLDQKIAALATGGRMRILVSFTCAWIEAACQLLCRTPSDSNLWRRRCCFSFSPVSLLYSTLGMGAGYGSAHLPKVVQISISLSEWTNTIILCSRC